MPSSPELHMCGERLTLVQHAQRKKTFAERYAMTNIANSQIIEGIKQRAESVVGKFKASHGSAHDVYVGFNSSAWLAIREK